MPQLGQAAVVIGLTSAAGAQIAPLAQNDRILQIGLQGNQYVAEVPTPEGDRLRRFDRIEFADSRTGQAAGFTAYQASDLPPRGIGNHAWFWDGQQSIRIGLDNTGAAATGILEASTIRSMNSLGVVGESSLFRLSEDFRITQGVATWYFDGVETQRIDPIAPAYRGDGPDRLEFSSFLAANDRGLVVGRSDRFDGSSFIGFDTWLYDASTDQTRVLFSEESSIRFDSLTNSGLVLAHRSRVTFESFEFGTRDLIVVDGDSIRDLGLQGSEYVFQRGAVSEFGEINEAGEAAGINAVYGSTSGGERTQIGLDSWIDTGSGAERIGLVTGEFISDAGVRFSGNRSGVVNGRVIGFSERLSASVPSLAALADGYLGRSAWLFNGTETLNIDLAGGRIGDGLVRQDTIALFDSGAVLGEVDVIGGSRTSHNWLYLDGVHTELGLFGSDYVNAANGDFESEARVWAADGSAFAGLSDRYNGGDRAVTRDAWYFDASTGITTVLAGELGTFGFSLFRLNADGFLFGSRNLLSEDPNELLRSAFVFRPDIGLNDLGMLVEGGLTDAGWDALVSAWDIQSLQGDAASLDAIFGHGLLSGHLAGSSSAAFVLVPAPMTASTGFLGLLLASRRRRAD
ncbi:MAG: hypothetical protein AAGI17_01710 [Planctomycetota bacterium]